eukprot:gene8477-10441_t
MISAFVIPLLLLITFGGIDIHRASTVKANLQDALDAATLAATAKTDDGSTKPQLAIDSSALGGMYAGAIRLVGTEQGVGVKLAGDMAASGGDIQIDANGKLTLARTAASGDIALKATDVDLTRSAYAGGKASVISGWATVLAGLAWPGCRCIPLSGGTQLVSTSHRLPGLDGLRALAVLCVLFSHVFASAGFPEIGWLSHLHRTFSG